MKGYCETHSHMTITRVDPINNAYGYKYLIQDGCTSYKAFRTFKGLRSWLDDHNLHVKFMWRTKRTIAMFKIIGEIKSINTFDVEFMESLKPDVHRVDLSNGDYVDHKILHFNGGSLVYHLNPNVRSRKVYDYRTYNESR